MSDSKALWTGALSRLRGEFKHAPVGTTVAVLALLDLTWRSIGSERGGEPPQPVTAADHINTGLPDVIPLLKFIGFQIGIVFVLHRVNFWISERAPSARIVVGLISAILAGYFTDLNAFYFARVMITTEGRHYSIFEPVLLMGCVITVFVLLVLQLESDEFPNTFSAKFSIVLTTIMPMAIVIILTCLSFDYAFMNRLEPIWSSTVHLP